MKQLKFIFTFCAIVVAFNHLSAQKTPGYMGKRFVAGYGIYLSPAYIGSKGESILNNLHEGYVEYATAKRFMVGFSARFYKAVYANGRYVNVNGSGYSSSAARQIDEHPQGTYDISGRNYMLYGKLFYSNYLAPWGRYFTFGATINTFKASYDSNKMKVSMMSADSYYSSYDYFSFTNFGPKEQSFSKFDISLGFGRSKIYGNRISVDYGYNINCLALFATLFDAPDDNIFGENQLSASEYIEKTGAARVRGVNRFNFFCKVGVLLF